MRRASCRDFKEQEDGSGHVRTTVSGSWARGRLGLFTRTQAATLLRPPAQQAVSSVWSTGHIVPLTLFLTIRLSSVDINCLQRQLLPGLVPGLWVTVCICAVN